MIEPEQKVDLQGPKDSLVEPPDPWWNRLRAWLTDNSAPIIPLTLLIGAAWVLIDWLIDSTTKHIETVSSQVQILSEQTHENFSSARNEISGVRSAVQGVRNDIKNLHGEINYIKGQLSKSEPDDPELLASVKEK